MTVLTPKRAYAQVEYPETDGRPIAESDRHRDEMFELIHMLRGRYKGAPDVYITGHMFCYYEEGNPSAVFAPDVMVVFGVPNLERRVYKLWEESLPLSVAFEISSRKTWRADVRTKPELYARLGVEEYYLYDPQVEYLEPPLQGFRLAGAAYQRVEPDEAGALFSPRLAMKLWLENKRIQLADPSTGERLRRPSEDQSAADRLAEENARLRAEIARLSRGGDD